MAVWNPLETGFQNLSDQTGFGIDQIRYIVLLFLSYPLALVLRYVLHPSHTNLLLRYSFSLASGLLIALFCFGWKQVGILFAIVMISYLMLIFLPPTVIQKYSMVWAIGSISATHIYRMITDYGGYHLDFTGPLMVMVQKITYVAYALHDGQARPLSELSKDQKEQKIESPPTVLVYLSYMFNFHSILAGPCCTFRQYLDFIDGSNFHQPNPSAADTGKMQSEPSIWYPVLKKMAGALLSLYLFITLSGYVDNPDILDPQYRQPYRLFLNYINSFRIRTRYYFIWLLAESINNCAGLGFSGYDKNGHPKWDLVKNLLILDIEFGTSLRSCINGWNALTSLWLRRCVYERATSVNPTLLTFVLSAWWHGFYPGYYLCFIYFGIATVASRKMRHILRPHFQSSVAVRRGYDVLTWFAAHIFRDFGVLCLDLMFLDHSIIYWSYYYYIPIITVTIIALSPWGGKSKKSSTATRSTSSPLVGTSTATYSTTSTVVENIASAAKEKKE